MIITRLGGSWGMSKKFEVGLRGAIGLTICLVAFLFVSVTASTVYFIIHLQSKKTASTSQQVVSELVRDSKSLLEGLAIQLLTEKAKDVSNQLKQLGRTQGFAFDINDPKFKAVAVQTIGEKGYSCVYECVSARMLAHPNSSLIGTDMRTLQTALPSWWRVFGPSLSCAPSRGYYDWKDADGSIRKKYMVMLPLEGTHLMVAATTYLDEFTRPMSIIEDEGHRKLAQSQTIFASVTKSSYVAVALSSLIFLGLMLLIGRYTSNALLSGLERIRVFAQELSLGNYEMKFGSPPQISDLKNIFNSLDRMRDQVLAIQKNRTDEASTAASVRLSRQIAHDLRSPLAALTVGLRNIQSTERDSTRDFNENVQMLHSATQRLREMAETVLNPKANFLQNIERFECAALLSELAFEYEQKYCNSERRITFAVTSNADSIHLIGSRINLQRVFSNLIQNGIEALPGGGRIEIQVIKSGTKCEISVSDNGIGIEEQYLQEIFKEGFTRGKRGGTGLGLSFCQQVISEHGGDIQVSSQPGKGTKVIVSFPLPVESASGEVRPASKISLPIQKGKRLLVIDDSVSMLTNWFKAAVNYGVEGDFFNSLEEAQKSIDWESINEVYGLAIIDYLIPQSKYDGIAVCRALRSVSENVPIVVCTSDSMNGTLRAYCEENKIELLPKTYFEQTQFALQQG
jgi:signal transduction histidine kinase